MLSYGFIAWLFCLHYAYAEEVTCSGFDFEYKMINKIIEFEQRLKQNEITIAEQKKVIDRLSNDVKGSVFVRWGRNQCPEDATLVYNGHIGGKKYAESGSGSDNLCLPSDPSWMNYTNTVNEWSGRIYGTEIELEVGHSSIFEKNNLHNQDMPCAVCKSSKSSSIMIPARSTCYNGWKLEYRGYLMAQYHGHNGPQTYICVDTRPDVIPNGGIDNNEHVLYLVEVVCGSLPCPPYVNGRELACVVCSQ